MSRIGKLKIEAKEGVTIVMQDNVCTVSGPKGVLSHVLPQGITVTVTDGSVQVTRLSDEQNHRAAHGLSRTLVANMMHGVTTGFVKQLEIQGVGYRAALQGSDLVLSLGYSHPVNVKAPEGISFKVEKNIISVSGNDKSLVGEIAAHIREKRKPEPYKGKGIRYVGERVLRKAGKAAKA